jgi:hypothetical protein
MKPFVRLRHVNFFTGFNDARCLSQVLMDLADEFEFIFDGEPDILLIGCYSQAPIGETSALKVGYYTENWAPDLVKCDYCFGCEYTPLIGHPRYCKRVFGPATRWTQSSTRTRWSGWMVIGNMTCSLGCRCLSGANRSARLFERQRLRTRLPDV